MDFFEQRRFGGMLRKVLSEGRKRSKATRATFVELVPKVVLSDSGIIVE